MKYAISFFFIILTACATKPPAVDIQKIQTQQQLDFAIQMAEVQKDLAIKEHVLGQYSVFGMALFAIGCLILAFSPVHRSGGFVFIAGGAVSMASLWLFNSEWFPWVAGTTAVIAVSLMIYKALKPSETC